MERVVGKFVHWKWQVCNAIDQWLASFMGLWSFQHTKERNRGWVRTWVASDKMTYSTK